MPLRTFHIQVGDQVFLEEGGEEIGAVRRVAKDHVVIYIEGAGDFTLGGPEIAAVHDGKVRRAGRARSRDRVGARAASQGDSSLTSRASRRSAHRVAPRS
jgi:hypothetical protein